MEGSALCMLCLALKRLVSSGLESPSAERDLRGGGDGVPAAASPETLGDPPDSGGRAGVRTRHHFPVSVRFFRPRVLWAIAGTWQEAVEAVVGCEVSPPPLNQPPPTLLVLREVEVPPGRLQGEFRCQTAVSDSAALGSDVSGGGG